MKSTANPASIDDYIAAYPADIQLVLRNIREVVSSAAPLAQEKISYKLPTFALGKDLVSFGAFKGHIGLYPPVREPEFQSRILQYRNEKGNLRFPLDQPIPYDLIGDIVKARVASTAPKGATERKGVEGVG